MPLVQWLGRHELAAAILAGILLAIGFILTHIVAPFTPDPQQGLPARAGLVLVFASLTIGLFYGGRAAIASLRALQFNIDVLMVLGALFAAWLGHPEEGALLLFLFVLASGLEELAMHKTRSAITALSAMIPTQTLVRRRGEWIEANPDELNLGEIALVRPGERAPTDGIVAVGTTEFNQSSLTGEPMPRPVTVGDEIFAGTINESHPVEVRVTKPAGESSIQRVLDLVRAAQERRQPIQRIIDGLSMPYSVSVVVICLLSFAVLHLFFGREWTDAAYTAITLLIVASPCALIIATPTATLSGISRAARAGVLFKGGEAIERLATMTCAAVDKTGTLTMGRPRVQEIHPVAWSDEEILLSLSAGLERGSTHPIAEAILDEAQRQDVEPLELNGMTFEPGLGIRGTFRGEEVRLGRYDFAQEIMPICLHARMREVMEQTHRRGTLAVAIAWKDQAGVFILHDEPRPGAEEMVRDLHAAGVRPIVMLTGDVDIAAQRLSRHLALDGYFAQLRPEEKLMHVERLRREHGRVAVVGDGVNDAPSLAASDAAIAVGGIGSDAALESADVILMNENLRTVPWALRLARRTRRIILANIIFAISAIVLLAIGTLTGWVNLPLGVLGHEGGTLLVVANGMRLLAFAAPNLHCTATSSAPVDEDGSIIERPGSAASSADMTSTPAEAATIHLP